MCKACKKIVFGCNFLVIGERRIVFSRMSPAHNGGRRIRVEGSALGKEYEPAPEVEPDSNCRLYLPCFRLFSTLRMSQPAALHDVPLLSLCDPLFGSIWTRHPPVPVSGSREHPTHTTTTRKFSTFDGTPNGTQISSRCPCTASSTIGRIMSLSLTPLTFFPPLR